MNSREIIQSLEADGWEHKQTTGSHWHFKHPTKPGLVTVPHPKREQPTGTVKAIEPDFLKAERVNVMIPRHLLGRIDAASGGNRSRFIVEAANRSWSCERTI